MKILVLNGSPKREGSDTMHITRAFLDGMQEAAPQDIHIIHTIDQHIEYCTGCFSCNHTVITVPESPSVFRSRAKGL